MQEIDKLAQKGLFNKKMHELMEERIYVLQEDDSLQKAINFLKKYNVSTCSVINKNKQLIGTITYPLIIEALLKGEGHLLSIQHVMRNDYIFCKQDDLINVKIFKMKDFIPVVDQKNKVIGTIKPDQLIERLLHLEDKCQNFEQMIRMYEFCFDTAYEGIAVVDENGYIKLFNESYARYTGVDKNKAIGKHCSEVIEGSRLPVVLETGIPERNQPHILQGQSMIVHRLPIWRGNKIIGAVGMLIYEGVSELFDTFDRAQKFFSNDHSFSTQIAEMVPKRKMITFDQVIGESIVLGNAKKRARKAAKTSATILLTGESGVGKEMFARSIHSTSPFSEGPFIAINCAAIPSDLLESELFGYEDGAFTGAKRGGKIGKFELAHNGTLFLDEIAEMPMNLQTKLLRVLQEQTFERVGGSREIVVNFRLIAATNKNLLKQIKDGEFREDLYYRINVIPVEIPALRERREDIPLLVSKLLEQTCKKHNVPLIEISKEVMQQLLQYDWPGNIRELANIIERIVVLAESKRIEYDDLKQQITFLKQQHMLVNDEEIDEEVDEGDSERTLYLKTLKEVAGNKTKAAEMLGIHRSTLYKKLKQYGIK